MNGGGTQRRERVAGAVPWAALTLVLLPFLVAIVVLLVVGGRFHAVGDQALDELFTRDVGHHAVLIGPFARDNWSHLGPAMFYLLSVPYRLTGSNSAGLWIGAALINAVAVATMALIAKRHGGTSLMMLTVLGCAVVMRALGADFLRDPWNPYLPVFSFGALVFLVWAMACGDAWALPLAAVVTTFCAQTHISYVILAVPLLVGGAVWLTWFTMRGRGHGNVNPPSRRRLVRAAGTMFGLLVLMWLPPVVEEFTNSPGNMSAVVRYFEKPPAGPHYSLLQGYHLVAGQFRAIPEWVTGVARPAPFTGEPVLLYRSPVPLLLGAFVAGSIVLWRRRRDRNGGDERGWRLAAIVAVALVLGVASVTRNVGTEYAYRVRWSLLIAMIATVVATWSAWTVIERRISVVARRVLLFTSLLTLGVFTGVDTVGAIRAGTPQQPQSAMVSKLAASTLAALPPGSGDVVVTSPDLAVGNQAGLVLWLERHGVAARVTPAGELGYGRHRVHRGSEPVRAVVTVASGTSVDEYAVRPDQRLVAVSGDFSVARREIPVARLLTLEAQYRDHKLDSETYLRRASALANELGQVTAVFLQAPSA